ncbi:enoyl-CoA hydratase/isomerase family protein [Mycobacterium sp. AT1]|uniref:enoyl-CoA hydratase/isomerase family protein n=1 Tax=Mycobacterium sp. AT1 TaxID=1961706 RepID=UPI0009AC6F6D|nr:enoyl-CoA hydratase-related protein [Mycobacterium sp. AT1]OPX13282.1 enoyl-CoA hydratase [Mycobacterium sp. AT1]
MTTTEVTTHSDDTVLLERHGAVATVIINRPKRRNALTAPARVGLRAALTALAVDTSVRAVVLTGAGGHFCAGQDLAEHAAVLQADPSHAFDTVEADYSPTVRLLSTMAKPVIAAIEGSCVGAGLGFALACDLRVVSTAASLSTAFSSIGLTCDSGLAHSLPRAVGDAKARELILLARPLSGAQADAVGLVTSLVDPGAALATATELAISLAAGPTHAYAESKQLLAGAFSRTLDENLAEEARAQARAGATSDHATAVRSFLAKATPTFIGR